MIEFFAEIGSNHGQSLKKALKLIEEAKEIKCTGVKFQYFKAASLWDISKFPEEYKAAVKRELPFEWIKELSNHARKRGLLFGLSVFDIESVELVKPYVDYFKIASFEAGWYELIEACYLTRKRLMISLGQVDKKELTNIITHLPESEKGNRIDLLHCVSKYPAQLSDCNIQIIKNNSVINGWSDHTVERAAILAAIRAGADVIEFHLDDGYGVEKDHSWTPWLISSVIETVNDMETAMGCGDWDLVASKQDRIYKTNYKTGLRG